MFKIDFFELSVLAIACIPPVPIARNTRIVDDFIQTVKKL